jgi:hypothetical protein
MKTEEIKAKGDTLKQLADKGAIIIAALKGYITHEFQGHIIIKEETQYSLLVSYYDFRLRFRIVLSFNQYGCNGSIVAYLEHSAANSQHIVGYNFDKRGHLFPQYGLCVLPANEASERRFTEREFSELEFSPHFIADVFASFAVSGATVAP